MNYRRNNQNRSLINNTSSGGSNIVGIDESPKLYLSETFKKKFPDIRLSYCSLKLEKKSRNNYGYRDYYTEFAVPRRCNFCENDFSTSESTLIFKCSQNHAYYCHTCYCIKPFRHHHDPMLKLELDTSNTEMYGLLQFYCKWNCGLTFNSFNLGAHLDDCKKNIYGQVLPRMFIANVFNLFSVDEKTHLISRSNLFSFEKYGFQNGEKVFVITKNNFKFVLHSSYENNVFHFWVSHDYPDNYCIEFKFREKLYKNDLKHNTLTLDNFDNHIIDDIWGFAVVLNPKVR